MKTQLMNAKWDAVECDALLLPIFEDEDLRDSLAAEVDRRLDGLLTEMKETGEWKGRFRDIAVIFRPEGLPARRLILLGAGKKSAYDGVAIRALIASAVHRIRNYSLRRVAVCRRSSVPFPDAAQAAVEAVLIGAYPAEEYKTEERTKTRIEEVLFVSDRDVSGEDVRAALKKGEILGEATNLARSLVNEPGNQINPSRLAEKAREIGERVGLTVEVLGEPEILELGMNAVMAVARGSDEPARFIVMKHLGAADGNERPAVLIGKGVTFDSGGISIKPAKFMEEMKADKAGACAVIAAMQAVAQLQLPRNVIGIVPAVENLPSGRAQRPGDVVRSMSGKTIEVINTDAEGRLILADAIHYARQFDPRFMIDVATLTGACVVALGHLRAGLFSNSEELCSALLAAAERAGEKFWRLPLDDEYKSQLKSQIADIKNVGDRWGGAITAAKFLQEFVGETPWCHLDIAGVDLYRDSDLSGATGFGVRTLVELVAEASPI